MDTPDGEDGEKDLLWKFTDEEVLCAEIAGLCHDLGNFAIPYSYRSCMLVISAADNLNVL